MGSYAKEFETVRLLLGSDAETRAVDAFALALLKAERQIRRLFTHLAFQFPCFAASDVVSFRETLVKNTHVFFEGFEKGIDALAPRTVADLVGPEYAHLRGRIPQVMNVRKKLFHGQLTLLELNRSDLEAFVSDLGTWCEALAREASHHYGYDGFERNSLRKSTREGMTKDFRQQFVSLGCYAKFINDHMERKGKNRLTEHVQAVAGACVRGEGAAGDR